MMDDEPAHPEEPLSEVEAVSRRTARHPSFETGLRQAQSLLRMSGKVDVVAS
jgi:hypothetical protein